MKKIALLTVILVLMLCRTAWAQNRCVAVVYDNSKSMTDSGQCEGINYAMQVLVGLLHQQDELYVFKMQPPNGTPINLFSKQDAIQQVSSTYNCLATSTPFAGIAGASQKLRTSTRKEKWLIILSDGDITETNFHFTYPDEFRQLVNQTGARIIFLNVNNKTSVLDDYLSNTGATAQTLRTQGNFTEIVNTMEQIASNIMSFSKGITVQNQGSKVTINSPVPLRRIVVLQQTSQTSGRLPAITAAKAETRTLTTNKSFRASKSKPGYSMSGNITHLESSLGLIPKGKVDIDFNGTVDMARTKFLPEAAAKLLPELKGNFKTVQGSLYKVCDTETSVTVTAKLLDDNNQPLDADVLKSSRVVCVNETSKQKYTLAYNEQTGQFTAQIPLAASKTVLSVSAEYTGYFNLLSNIYTLEKENCPVSSAGFDAAGGKATLRALVTNLNNAPSVTVMPKIYAPGSNTPRTPSPQELEQLEVVQLNDSHLKLSIHRQNGTITIKPATRICACFTPTGTENVQFELRSKSPTIKVGTNNRLTVEVTIDDDSFWAKCGPVIIALLVLAVLLWYLIGIIKKPRFCRGSEIIYTRETNIMKNRPRSYPLPSPFFKRYLIPYKPEKQIVGGIMFKAGSRCSHVLVAAESQNENMFIMGMPVDNPGKKDMRLSNGERMEVARTSVKEMYEYRKLDNSNPLG